MRTTTGVGCAVAMGLIVAALSDDAVGAVLFGWAPFLSRVLPQVRPDGPTVAVGAAAVILFAAGVHGLGRSLRNGWRVRATATVVLGILFLFTAGIAVIGVTHQIAWLATSDQPMVAPALTQKNWRKSVDDRKQLALGLTGYISSKYALPPGGTFDENGEMRHSWETHILPELIFSTNDIDFNRPWNAPVNRRYFQCVIPVFINGDYRTPPLEDADGFGLSHYAANVRVMAANKGLKIADLPAGAAETILVGEVNAGFKPWGHPVNWRDPAAGLTGGPKAFGGPPGRGTTFVMADGSVRTIAADVDPAVLRALSGP